MGELLLRINEQSFANRDEEEVADMQNLQIQFLKIGKLFRYRKTILNNYIKFYLSILQNTKNWALIIN